MEEMYEYLVVDGSFMTTNRTGRDSTSNETSLSLRLTNEYGKKGWKLVDIFNEDFIFIRPLPQWSLVQDELKKKVEKPVNKKQEKKRADPDE